MTGQKKIVVFGATGAQGGSVVRALASGTYASQFQVVGVTRNPQSDKAKALVSELGGRISLVAADLDKPDTLREAVRGAWGVFGLTNFWEIFDMHREIQQGKNIVDACRDEKVHYVIYSGLPSARHYDPTSTLVVDHLDGKAEIEKYLLSEKNASIPVRAVSRVGCYIQNWMGLIAPHPTQDGSLVLTLPMEDKKIQLADVEAYGPVVAHMFAEPEKYNHKTITYVSDFQSVDAICQSLSKAVGVKISYNDIPHEQFGKLGFPGADELARMFLFFCRYWQNEAEHNLKVSRELSPKGQTFDQWAQKHANELRQAYKIA